MTQFLDTIVAQSSPLGNSPRAIIRLSGPQILAAALTLFEPRRPIDSAATWCWFNGLVRVACGGAAVAVPAALFLMRAPRSYTREDVVELHLPGNAALVAEVLAGLCRAGPRPASPGEFTARAFTSGRLDLAQAEAVMAVINAGGRRSLAAAQRLLAGRTSGEVRRLVARLRDVLARVEVAIDFSEENLTIISAVDVAATARSLRDDIVALSRRSREVSQLEGDLRVVLVGRPNVGKSSLFNRLAGADRAIVTAVAGTTRDEIRETFTLAGSRFVLSDTAGLDDVASELESGHDLTGKSGCHTLKARQRRDQSVCLPDAAHTLAPIRPGLQSVAPIETNIHRAAQDRTLAAMSRAELVLVVIEAVSLVAEAAVRDELRRLLETLVAPAILVVNKCDLPIPGSSRPAADLAREAAQAVVGPVRVVTASASTGEGLDDLRAAIIETLRLGEVDRAADFPAVSARHRQCLESAAESLERVVDLCGSAAPAGAKAPGEELLALELREALEALGGITGETSPQEVLNEIFAHFCIGK
jgi:tRNA modification GTPase